MAQSWSIDFPDSSRERAFAVALKAITELGYSVTHGDAGSGTISFKTGMSLRTWQGQEMSATAITSGPNAQVVVSAARRGFQAIQWGEKAAIANRVFEKIREVAPHVSEPPQPRPPESGQSTASELARLAELHQQGALTDDEFRAAKAKLLA